MAGHVSRREFLRSSTAQAAGAAAGVLAATRHAKAAPHHRLRVGLLGCGSRAQAHVRSLMQLAQSGKPVEIVAVCDVFNRYRETTADRIQKETGHRPRVTSDFREITSAADIDIVVVATPDHWHATMTLAALEHGKAVYCEKPMTHTIEEAVAVAQAWRRSGQVMQVGVQRTSDGRWRAANELLRSGGIGKVVQAQTEYYRNSSMGQGRQVGLSRDMTPENIDWEKFLGTEFGLAPEMQFDRARFAQWRCYWDFGSGMYSDLFVHRLTQMLIALGVTYPRRVVGSGGIFLEYDGRDVPDTGTLVADYDEGLQIVVSATMCCDYGFENCIRGHHGTVVFDMSRDGFDLIPQRPQITRQAGSRKHYSAARPKDETLAHWQNFVEAVELGAPELCHNTPDLGAAAVVTVNLAAESYRQGKIFEWHEGHMIESGPGYAHGWETLSQRGSQPRHISGWNPVEQNATFTQRTPDYQKLAGPWKDANSDPAG